MATILMRFPGGKRKAVTLSYDDGVIQDIRFIEIMKKYGLKGTFNINSGLYAPEGTEYDAKKPKGRMTRTLCIDTYANSGMEVAAHGLTHPFLEHLPVSMQTQEVMQDRANLEKEFGTIIRGMAYPYGTYSDEIVETLKACGILYCRTTTSTERFDIPTDWLRMPATCHHNNPRLMKLAEEFLTDDWTERPKLFYLWGHSFELDNDDNWNVIEEFGQYIGNREDIWYATNMEVYEYVEAYRQLVFSIDGTIVYNPTSTTLYFWTAGRVVCIKPGETITI